MGCCQTKHPRNIVPENNIDLTVSAGEDLNMGLLMFSDFTWADRTDVCWKESAEVETHFSPTQAILAGVYVSYHVILCAGPPHTTTTAFSKMNSSKETQHYTMVETTDFFFIYNVILKVISYLSANIHFLGDISVSLTNTLGNLK